MDRSIAAIEVGDQLPPLMLPSLDRATLALFAGASGDHHPIHIDTDYARRAGAADVFGHGMLGMAWMGRLVTRWVPQNFLRSLQVRFTGVLELRDALTCTATVMEKRSGNNECRLRLRLEASNQHGEVKMTGEALVAMPALR